MLYFSVRSDQQTIETSKIHTYHHQGVLDQIIKIELSSAPVQAKKSSSSSRHCSIGSPPQAGVVSLNNIL